MIHENSVLAIKDLDIHQRRAVILMVFRGSQTPLTDREVAQSLGFGDMNQVRPRITEMIDDGILEECGKIKDSITHRMVRATRIRRDEEEKAQASQKETQKEITFL